MKPITQETSQSMPTNILRTLAVIAVLVGAVGSLVRVLYVGRQNNSFFLIALFVGWVLSPFVAMLAGNVIAKRWSASARVTLYYLMLFIPLGSLVVYSGVLSPPGTKGAFVFLVVPLVSWLLMGIAILVNFVRSRKRPH